MLPPVLAIGLVPALIALPTVTPPQAAAHPVAPVVNQVALGGVSGKALAEARSMGRAASPRTLAAGPARPAVVGDDVPEVFTEERDIAMVGLVGVTWKRGTTPRGTTIQLRTRTDGTWTGWQLMEVAETPPASSPEGRSPRRRAATEPLITPNGTNGVQVRVDTADGRVPEDLRLELVDPGKSAADRSIGARPPAVAAAEASRPTIYSRATWGADESLRDSSASYESTTKAFVIHHTASSNNYDSSTTASQIRSIYAYATQSEGYSDMPYNFIVDKYGRIFEGRAGGVDKPVRSGATGGFNDYTSNLAALGNFDVVAPSPTLISAMSQLAAWKLGIHRVDPLGTTSLTARYASGTTSNYRDGERVTVPTILAHRQVGATACPGRYIYSYMASMRSQASAYAGVRLSSPSFPTHIPWSTGKAALTAHTPSTQYLEATVRGACSTLPVRVILGMSTGSTNNLVWDGRTSTGAPAGPGQYAISVRTWTAAGTAVPWVGTVTVVTTPTSPPATCPVLRWAGTTAPATNVMIGVRVAPAATSVVIVPSLTAHRQDAALAGTLAYAKKAPVLVADQTSVSKEVLAEITRRRATTAYVVASGSGLTSTVDTQLKAAGITTIVNVRGGERIETAAVAAKSLGGARPTVFLVSSAVARSRDAILATAAGASAGMPVLYTDLAALPAVTSAALTALGTTRVVLVGSTAEISSAVYSQLLARGIAVQRIGTSSIEGNALALADYRAAAVGTERVSMTGTGAELEAAALAASGKLLLLTPSTALSAGAKAWLDRNGVTSVQIGGDTVALSEPAAEQVAGAVR